MFFAEKGPNVYTSNIDQQVSYLVVWACEHFASAPPLCAGSTFKRVVQFMPWVCCKKSLLEMDHCI